MHNESNPKNWSEAIHLQLQDFIQKYFRVPKIVLLGEDTYNFVKRDMQAKCGYPIDEIKELYGLEIRIANLGMEQYPKRYINFLLED